MKKHNFMAFIKGIVFVQLIVLVAMAGISVDINQKYTQVMKLFDPERILLPFSDMQISTKQAEMLIQENNVVLAGVNVIPDKMLEDEYYISTIPANLINSHIQALAFADPSLEQPMVEEDLSLPVVDNEELDVPLSSETLARFSKSKIFFYCTHSAESYIPNSGKARLDGKRGLINQVAASLENNLNERGLPAQFVDTIHDFPNYNQSYINSRVTVNKIVAANKNILGLFDVHRDSIPGEGKAASVKIKGRQSARILIVVGTNERKPHPNWQQNRKFAESLYQQGEKMYPGLIKGVITKAGTYNQEFHPRALLLEFGSDSNTLDQVTYAAQLFNDVLIEVLKEVT